MNYKDKIAQDIKAYLANGGKITAVPMHSWINESRLRKISEGKV